MEATTTFNIITTGQMGDAKLTKFILLSSLAKTVVLQLKHSILELVDTKETMVYQMMKSQIQ